MAPPEISNVLDFVVGGIGFPLLRNDLKTKGNQWPWSVGDAFPIGPSELRKRYNVSDYGGKAKNNSQAVAEFQDQFYSPSDLKQFFKQFVSGDHTDTVTKVVGQNNDDSPGVEASLDIQYIMGVAPDVPTWFWSNPSMDFFSDLTSWVQQLEETDDVPLVHSVSYGDQAEGPSGKYKDRLNTEFQKLATRGLTLIFASGDSGTGCDLCWYFEPSFPATSPYVTSVGATQFKGSQVGDEEAVTSFGSGGGFSWHFPTPKWQTSATQGYLSTEKDLPESHFYSASGRGTPDVAALGIGFQVIVNGAVNSVGGTSASAPTFAGIVSLLNDFRMSEGKPPLGFLNQWLYNDVFVKNPNAFYDVTEGNNHHGCCGYTGFYCNKGWDPVTGIGTPNYGVLKQLVKELP